MTTLNPITPPLQLTHAHPAQGTRPVPVECQEERADSAAIDWSVHKPGSPITKSSPEALGQEILGTAPAPTGAPHLKPGTHREEIPRFLGTEEFSVPPGAHLLSPVQQDPGPGLPSAAPGVDLSMRATGAPSPDAEAIEKTIGVPMTAEGLARFYEGAMPGVHGMAMIKSMPGTGDLFTSCTFRNGEGETMGALLQVFKKHDDGSLELELGEITVKPEFREKGLVPSLILRDVELLKKLSAHPGTRLTLRAAGFTPGVENRQFGTYVWARYGLFEFSRPGCLPEMKEKYSQWVDKKAAQLSLDPATTAKLKSLSSPWSHPAHIAGARLEGLTFPVSIDGKEPRPCDVGKAFLLSEDAPAWYGKFPVNLPLSDEAEEGTRVLLGKVSDAEEKRESTGKRWAATLENPESVEAIISVLQEIGREGGQEWLKRLKSLENDRILGAAAACAARQVEGKELTLQLARIFMDEKIGEKERVGALSDFERAGGHLNGAMADTLLGGKSTLLRGTAFNIAFRNAENDRELALWAAGEVLARTEVPEKLPFWPRSYRLDAVRALMALEGNKALPKFEKLARMEKDPVTRQAITDCVALLQGAPPQGAAALPIGEYPPETWK